MRDAILRLEEPRCTATCVTRPPSCTGYGCSCLGRECARNGLLRAISVVGRDSIVLEVRGARFSGRRLPVSAAVA